MFGFAKMVNLAKSPEQVKGEIKGSIAEAPAMPDAKVPVYPYGLCLSLDEDSLAKLGLDDDLPEVGETVHFAAMGRITSVNESERESADGTKTKCCRVELQITDMAVPAQSKAEASEEESDARRSALYKDD